MQLFKNHFNFSGLESQNVYGLYLLTMSRTHFRELPECQGTPCLKQARKSEVSVTATGLETKTLSS